MEKKYHIIPILCWIGLGFFLMILSYKLGLGRLHNPGPGLMPFLVGVFLLLTSLFFLKASLFRKGIRDETGEEEPGQTNFLKIGIVLVSLFAYAFLLEILGYCVVTFLVLFFLFRSMGSKWSFSLVVSVLTVLITYFLFTYLGIRFPWGIFSRMMNF